MKTAFRRLVARMFENQVRRLVNRYKLRVVAVAGSVGKTSTKLAVATMLRQKYRTLVHEGNFNTELGLPLSIFELDVPRHIINPFAWIVRLVQAELKIRHYPYQVLVLELGTDHPGEMAIYFPLPSPGCGRNDRCGA
jgi:UDP-N-acetylmuramoyl-tripeptide--D-alanyl-D-alanine ligase